MTFRPDNGDMEPWGTPYVIGSFELEILLFIQTDCVLPSR